MRQLFASEIDKLMEKNENKDTQKTASDPMAMSFLLHAKQIENFFHKIIISG